MTNTEKVMEALDKDMNDGTRDTPRCNHSYRAWMAIVRKALKPYAKDMKFHKGFFYVSMFFTTFDGRMYNIFSSDFRHFGADHVIIRTVESYKDYTGGRNNEISFDAIDSELANML